MGWAVLVDISFFSVKDLEEAIKTKAIGIVKGRKKANQFVTKDEKLVKEFNFVAINFIREVEKSEVLTRKSTSIEVFAIVQARLVEFREAE